MSKDDIMAGKIINLIEKEILETMSINDATRLFDFLIKKGVIKDVNLKLVNLIIKGKRDEIAAKQSNDEFDLLESLEEDH